jgi:hypothetical protein
VTRCLRGISTRQGGEHHIKFCKLILNDAQGNLGGGAVNAEGALVTFYSCVFTQNTANGGAALASYRGGAWLYNCTVFANATTGLGGAVLVSSEAGAGTVTIVNSILEENAGAVVNALGTAGGVVQGIHTTFVGGGIAGGYNDLGGNSYASSPQIAPGASGADGVFGTPDDLPVLRSDASAIDTGTNTSFINFTTTDLLGNRRVHDGDANGVATVDRGAVEHLSPRYSPLLYVHAGLATGRNDGTDWNNAFRGSQGLQNALLFASVQNSLPRSPGESAVPYPSMWVARGTYTPAPPGGSRSASFSLLNNLAIYDCT